MLSSETFALWTIVMVGGLGSNAGVLLANHIVNTQSVIDQELPTVVI